MFGIDAVVVVLAIDRKRTTHFKETLAREDQQEYAKCHLEIAVPHRNLAGRSLERHVLLTGIPLIANWGHPLIANWGHSTRHCYYEFVVVLVVTDCSLSSVVQLLF